MSLDRTLILALLLVVSACAITEDRLVLPGASLDDTDDGFMVEQRGEGQYRIQVTGSRPFTSIGRVREAIRDRWNRKARELCPNGIYESFLSFGDPLFPTIPVFEELKCGGKVCAYREVGRGDVICKKP